jgi:hypothetical protein
VPRPTWIPKVLAGMGWQDNATNSLALDLWSLSEDSTYVMQSRCHNYIAIIWPPSPLKPWNSFKCGSGVCHVQCYASEAAGVAATVSFLEQSQYSILDEAMTEPPWKGKLEKIFYAINGGAFCTGCQGGKYPIRLYDYLAGHIRTQPSNVLIPGKPIEPPKKPISIFKAWHDLTRQLEITIPRELRRIEKDRRAMLNVVKAAETGRGVQRRK